MEDVARRAVTAERHLIVLQWATLGGDKSPRAWLKEREGYDEVQYNTFIAAVPASEWYARRKEIQDKITYSLVKEHADFVADMNDTHIKAAKLGLAKAIDMMTRMRIEERRDKKGSIYFAGFKPSDLKACMDSIKEAQFIMRRALGLPNDEGSITAWQKIQFERTTKATVDGEKSVTEKVSVEGTKALEDSLSYDDIKMLIDAERRKQAEERAMNAKTIDAKFEARG